MLQRLPLFFLTLFVFSICYVTILTKVEASRGIPILTYHYIRDYNYPKDTLGISLSVSPTTFDQQMNYLSSHGYTPITLDTLYGIFKGKAARPAKPIVLTFDDGYIDFYANAYPILKKYNFHAVSFVVTGFVGQSAYLSWNNIHEMQSSGLISFEAHTITHAYLPNLSYANMLKELQQSKATLQAQNGTVINFIAYPYGASNWNVQKAAQTAGFVGGLGTWGGYASYPSMNMPRIAIRNSLQSISSRFF
ncbi:MAG TPA: polysaccharide deacetylase family protein [Candidatus Sulfotelmatobacter sp.]|jgi:peptidoglycan/xylan/chitin deacetylase (PgdA/CDA1 family)|nr:polysaccharide deacetylase family protein [Candidatus Sulfotelmatobacter sp.]